MTLPRIAASVLLVVAAFATPAQAVAAVRPSAVVLAQATPGVSGGTAPGIGKPATGGPVSGRALKGIAFVLLAFVIGAWLARARVRAWMLGLSGR